MYKRIIPCLDISNGRVVKGVNFVGLSDIGDPLEIAKAYEQQGADEITLLDITADSFSAIRRVVEQISVPVIVGGGLRDADDINRLLDCGAAKVSIGSAAVTDPGLIRERVIVAIDAKGRDVYVNGGRTNAGLDLLDWAKKCQDHGASEILLTSMDADGTQNGYDIAMLKAVIEVVDIPVIASGGCGSVGDIIDVFKQTDCSAALVASLFHYGKATVGDVKDEMERNGIPCKR